MTTENSSQEKNTESHRDSARRPDELFELVIAGLQAAVARAEKEADRGEIPPDVPCFVTQW